MLDLSDKAGDFRVREFQSTFRYDEDGAPHVDFIVQCTQHVDPSDLPDVDPQLVSTALRRTTTVIFDESGRIRYVISKPLPAKDGSLPKEASLRANQRAEYLDEWLDNRGARNPGPSFGLRQSGPNRLRVNFALLHRGLE